MTTRISMNKTGRITLPASMRKLLRIDGEAEFEVEATEEGTMVLRPVVVMRREDAWAYTREHRERLRRAHDDSREGRVRQLSEEDLRGLAPTSDD